MRRRPGLAPLLFIVVIALGGLGATLATGNSPHLGLDLQGGTSVVLEPTVEPKPDQLTKAIEVIRNRVDGLGVAEPEITQQGKFVVVALPGVKDPDRAIKVVGQTAKLQFRPVVEQVPANPEQPLEPSDTGATLATVPPTTPPPAAPGGAIDDTGLPTQQSKGQAGGEQAAAFQEPAQTPPASDGTSSGPPEGTQPGAPTTTPVTVPEVTAAERACGPQAANASAPGNENQEVVAAGKDENDDGLADTCYRLGPTQAGGDLVSSARADLLQSGGWAVSLSLSDNGRGKFNEISTTCFSSQPPCTTGSIAALLDNRVESSFGFKQPTFDTNDVQIGNDAQPFKESDARDLSLALSYGSLPVEFKQSRVETVSATLGRDSLNAGLVAGGVGVALVSLYIMLYYRILGVVVVAGLVVWSALNFTIITYLSSQSGLALSLSGVTGIIVSVGVTVDSYVVYFERLKDEVRDGRSLRSAVDRGFERAWKTVITADTSSFIGALLLYWLTVGAVRGFAFFLGLSTLLDVVVTWFFTRPLVKILCGSDFFINHPKVGAASALGVEPTGLRSGGAVPAASGAGK
jgi:preprotein translocase subunit SecD